MIPLFGLNRVGECRLLRKGSGGKVLTRDDKTRWNSRLDTLDWFLKPELRRANEEVSFSEKRLYND